MPATPARAHSAPGPNEPSWSHADARSETASTSRSRSVSAAGYTDENDLGTLRSAPTASRERHRERLSQPPSPHAPHPHVEPLTPITATGGAIVAIVASSLAAILDALLSPGLGVLFGFVFVLSSILIALRMCWYDAWAALALPPLVFIVAAGVAAQVAPASSGSWLHRTSTDMAIAVLDHPVSLLAGTLLAAAAIIHRARVE